MAHPAATQDSFQYTDTEIDCLIRALSEDRLTTFMDIAQGNIRQALRLYEYNIALSEALYVPLHGVEICLRNAIHRTLSNAYARLDWYDDLSLRLKNPQRQALDKAKSSLQTKGKPLAPARVIAELPFGFWVGLLGKTYAESKLWGQHLRKAFPHGKGLQRKRCHAVLQPLRELRNRIAHHEPILKRNLAEDHQNLLTVAGWICPVTQRWIAKHSRFLSIISHTRQDRMS